MDNLQNMHSSEICRRVLDYLLEVQRIIKRWIMYCVLIFLGTKATHVIQLTCFVAVQLIPLHQKNVKYKVLKMFALKREKKFGLAESCTNTAHGSNCPIYPYLCPGGDSMVISRGEI